MKPELTPPDIGHIETVRAYHQRTKHAFGRYAASPGYLDWDTQPDPFRRFEGSPKSALPLSAGRFTASYADLFAPGEIQPAALDIEGIGALLELSFGLAAWKQYGGDRWALRCNPSSGNLHPTEAYAVAGNVAGLANGVHHYVSHDHALEHRGRFDPPFRGLLVGLSSIHWREAWKYGERAFRYCQHDAGHAVGALRYAAAVLGWRMRLLDAWGDGDIAALLGLDRTGDFAGAEPEAADLLCLIDAGREGDFEPAIDELVTAARSGHWSGRANALSARHEHDWPVIEEVCAAARKPGTPPFSPLAPTRAQFEDDVAAPANPSGQSPPDLKGPDGVEPAPNRPVPPLPAAFELPAVELIKQRRSAQAFDGVTSIAARSFFRILDATLPRPGVPPFDGWNHPPRIHLALFVHRVQGLPPGIYVLCRHGEAGQALRAAMDAEFAWEPAEGRPGHLPLFRLLRADARQAARTLSCHQDIAGDGAFSLGMLAEFDAALAEGPWVYRRLFWECGLVGQALYLEAEAAGVRGTGIGCFFDDPVHEVLGLQGTAFQSLYHFTVGGPLVDSRLQSLPGYWHLGEGTQVA